MKTFYVNLTDLQEKILLNDLLDIDKWIQGMVLGKINNCKERAAIQYKEEALKSGLTSIPLDPSECASCLFQLKTYMNRTQREATVSNEQSTVSK